MIDSIFVAQSGMRGHERGLNVISNNVSNLNTPGFHGSAVAFMDLLNQQPPMGGQGGWGFGGRGVDATRTMLNLTNGETQQTGRDLDVRLDGSGYFVLRDEGGELRYSRAGRLTLDDGGLYFDTEKRIPVMTRLGDGRLVPLSVKDLRPSNPKATETITLGGQLLSTDESADIPIVTVFDENGLSHNLKLNFTYQPISPTNPQASWLIKVFEGAQELGSGSVTVNGFDKSLVLSLALKDAAARNVKIDLTQVSMLGVGLNSLPTVDKVDGSPAITITGTRFDETGMLKVSYSDGETRDGPRLILAQIADTGALVSVGGALFDYRGATEVVFREAGSGLRVIGQALELSNVDLTGEFSELILMQRGYQAASQVLSTASDMMQDLMNLRGQR